MTVNFHRETWPLLGDHHFEEIIVESIMPKPIESVDVTAALAAALDDDDDNDATSRGRRYRGASAMRS